MFEVKWNYYAKPIKNCDAGKVSLWINLITGNMHKCLCQPAVDNLFDTTIEHISFGGERGVTDSSFRDRPASKDRSV